MSDADQILRNFRQSLDGLKENDKNKITKLTLLAKDYVQIPGFPQKVVETTVRHVYEVAAVYKLLGLYVIDSIVKNVDVPYRKLFTDSIVQLFIHSFQMSRDENTRKRLFNLRTTWKDIFPYSKMHSLDIAVRELDPAWPLIPKDETPSESRIPSVPKLPSSKVNNKLIPTSSASPLLNPVISESRDPRLCKKRKPSPDSSSTDFGGQFLIDRDGNRKMEMIARKHGRYEEEVVKEESRKSKTLFSVKDQDMRSFPTSSSVSSTASSIPVTQANKSQRVDVDMRLGGQTKPVTTASTLPPRSQTFEASVSMASEVTNRLPPPVVPNIENVPRNMVPPPHFGQPLMRPLNPMPGPHQIPPPFRMMASRMPPYRGMNPEMPPQMLPPPHPNMPPGNFGRPPHPGPQISGPDWSVEIDGLNHMIQIGIDPRMLFRAANPKPERLITIDGCQYPLLLDRIQPLIKYGDNYYAVRFRCENMAFIIDRQRIVVPGTGFTRLRVLGRDRLVYLGGPGHELVIDGRPHTIPFNTTYSTIIVDQQTVPVRYDCDFPTGLNVLPPIPRQILDWGYRGLFGSPNNLHLAPKNPLHELEKLAENRMPDSTGPINIQFQQPPPQQQMPPIPKVEPRPTVTTEVPLPSTSTAAPPQPLPVSVDDLLSKLVASGVFNTKEVLPDIKEYSWEKFRRVYTPEVDALYSGFQCLQCGFRFPSETDPTFVDHLDYHYMKNSTEYQGRRSRNYYQPASCWLSSGLMEDTGNAEVTEVKEYKCVAFPDEKLNVCAVCGDKFDKVYDRQKCDWMLLGAIVDDGKAYHPICREDAGKQFPVTFNTIEGSSVATEEPHFTSLKADEEGETQVSVSPVNQQFVPVKSDPDLIESNGTETLHFSSYSSSSSGIHVKTEPQIAHLPSEASFEDCKKLDANIDGHDEEKIKEPVDILPETSAAPPPGLPSSSFPIDEDDKSRVIVSSGIVRDSGSISIPGLSPTNSVEGVEEAPEEHGISGGGGGGVMGQNLDSANSLVTSDTISSNPLAALEAVLGHKMVLP